MKIGFIGLGNVGGKLAGSLLRNGYELTVRDLNREIVSPFLEEQIGVNHQNRWPKLLIL